jgi:hypothetical protein
MKSKWILAAVAVSISLSAVGTAAQGPQGTGAAEAAQSSSGPHLSNPIKWIKKEPHTETASLDANSNQNAKLTAKLQTQGLVPANADLKDTCLTIKELGECVAALHAGHNLGLDFDCLKSKLSGVQTRLDAVSCASTTDGKPVSLIKAIHSLKPNADAKAEAKKAEEQSREDLKEAGSGT